MTTIIEDGELNSELQELYLVDKQWMADLDFLDNELAFLTKLANEHTDEAIRKEESKNLISVGKTYVDLRDDMMAYLHQLEPLITGDQTNFDLSLIEKYSELKQRLSDVLKNCQAVRARVFNHSKHGLNSIHFSTATGK